MLVPDLPGHGRNPRLLRGLVTLAAMSRAITDLLDGLDRPAVIVAHSRSGIVASDVSERRPEKVRRAVYLAAFMLRSGERAADYFFSDAGSALAGNVHVDRLRGTDMIAGHVYEDALYADCSAADVALARALLAPTPSLPAVTRLALTEARYGRVPRAYIELTQDRAVTPTLQRTLCARTPVEERVTMDASHSAYFSRPSELAATIARLSAR